MLQKKLIISAVLIIAVSFAGFLIGFLYQPETKVKFSLQIYSENEMPGIEIALNNKQIAAIDSSGFFQYNIEVKTNEPLDFSFQKPGFIVIPNKKSYLANSAQPNNEVHLKTYFTGHPKLKINVKDWRGKIVSQANIIINKQTIKKKSDYNGNIEISLKDKPVGSVLEIDVNKGTMFVLKGNDPVNLVEQQENYIRNIVLYERPQNWLEFSITDGNNPVKGVSVYRDGKKTQVKFNGTFYTDWVHEINKVYQYKFTAPGYKTKSVRFSPSDKGKNHIQGDIVLEALRYSLRVIDKTGLEKRMNDISIFDRRGREIGQTDPNGIVTNLSFWHLNRSFNLMFERLPDFPRQTFKFTVRQNGETLIAKLKPKSFKRLVKLCWEKGQPIKNALVQMKGSGGLTLQERPNSKGIVTFEDPRIKPNRDYCFILKTEYGDKEIEDTPTEFQLKNNAPLKIKFERYGVLHISIEGESGKIEIRDLQGKLLHAGQDQLNQRLIFGKYKIKCIGKKITKEEIVDFYQKDKPFVCDLTDPCDLLAQKIDEKPDYLSTTKGKDELEDLYFIIDNKINQKRVKLSGCEAKMLRRYADIKYNEKEYFTAEGAYQLIISFVKGEDKRAVNYQRLGRSKLYYALTNRNIEITKKRELVDQSLEAFENADIKIATSVRRDQKREFKTNLSFNRAEALTMKYELEKMSSSAGNLVIYKKEAENAWEEFLFQYNKCETALQSKLSKYKSIAEIRINELKYDISG